MQVAGGVGGMLSTTVGSDTYYPVFDANGNIMYYLDNNADTVASYTYDPFGSIHAQSGGRVDVFSYKFSTKPQDDVSGLYYYGFRYYDAENGRWPSKDPLGEQGGINLYRFMDNDGVNYVDYLGLVKIGGKDYPDIPIPGGIPNIGPGRDLPRDDEPQEDEGIGDIHESTHTMRICFPNGDVSRYKKLIYDDLKVFNHFSPNNTTVSFNSGTRITTFRVKGGLGLLMKGTSSNPFQVRVSYPGSFTVLAKTLDKDKSPITGRFDGHPLVGWRNWTVTEVGDSGMLEIKTQAKERARNVASMVGRFIGGGSTQNQVWVNYFNNIGKHWKNKVNAIVYPVRGE
jgi:RHS repeat-associated protein